MYEEKLELDNGTYQVGYREDYECGFTLHAPDDDVEGG